MKGGDGCPGWSPSPRRRLCSPRPLGDRADARDRLHQPHREGPPRLMTTLTPPPRWPAAAPDPSATAGAASRIALWALLQRDLVVLRKHVVEFVIRTLVQPFLLVLRLPLRVPDRSARASAAAAAGGRSAFATVLVPGVVGISIMFQGVQSVAMQLSRSSGSPGRSRTGSRRPARSGWWPWPRSSRAPSRACSRRRSCSPSPRWSTPRGYTPISTSTGGSCHPATAGVRGFSAAGPVARDQFEPRNIGLMFGFIVLPITFLGGTYYHGPGWRRSRSAASTGCRRWC